MIPASEKVGIAVVALLLASVLVLGTCSRQERLCDTVCKEHDECKEENTYEGKYYDFTEVICNDGTKLQISKEKKK